MSCDALEEAYKRGYIAGGIATLSPAAQRVDGWQPIESAPKDGTRILAVTSSGYYILAQWMQDSWHNNTSANWIPTHWMPLPEPPAAHAAQDVQEGL